MFQNVPLAIKSYIACFLPLDEYIFMNLLRIPVKFSYYYKHNKLPESIDEICKNKNLALLHLVQYLCSAKVPLTIISLDCVIYYENYELAQWIKNTYDFSKELSSTRYISLNITTIKKAKFLHSIGHVFSEYEINDFVKSNQLDIIKYLCLEVKIPNLAGVLQNAIRYPQLEIIKFLHEECKQKITPEIVSSSYYFQFSSLHTLECVKYLQSIGFTYSEHSLRSVFRHCSIETIKYLHEECEYKFGDGSMEIACLNQNIEVVKYVHSKGLKVNEYAMYNAIYIGKLECVKFLHYVAKVKCTKATLYCATRCKQMEIIKFLHEELGIPITKKLIFRTEENYRYDLFFPERSKPLQDIIDYLTQNYYLVGTTHMRPAIHVRLN